MFNTLSMLLFFTFALIGFLWLLHFSLGLKKTKSEKNSDKSNFHLFNILDDPILITNERDTILFSNDAFKTWNSNHHSHRFSSLFTNNTKAEIALYQLKVKALRNEYAQEEICLEHSDFLKNSIFCGNILNVSVRSYRDAEEYILIWRFSKVKNLNIESNTTIKNFQYVYDHFDQAPAGLMVIDNTGIVQYINTTLALWLHIDNETIHHQKIHINKLFTFKTFIDEHYEISDDFKNIKTLKNGFLKSKDKQTPPVFLQIVAIEEYEQNDHIIYRFVVINSSSMTNKKNRISDDTQFLFNIIDHIPFAMGVLNTNKQLIYSNKFFQDLFDTSFKKNNLIEIHEILSSQSCHQIDHIFENLKTKQISSQWYETTFDNDRHLNFHIFNLFFDNYKESDAIAILSVQEKTEQKRIEDKMAEGQKMQAVGQLAGGIAHDFNNVLTAILMSCDLLLASHRSSDPTHADLINIKNNANRAASLVQQLLAFSRRQTLRPEVADLTDLLSDIRALLIPLLGSHTQLKVVHGRDLWRVKVDLSSFQRVVMNLVINARDAMPDGGVVHIKTSNMKAEDTKKLHYSSLEPHDYVVIDVQDTGTGIPKSIQEKMFEPFFTTKEVGKGTGLGLSMVYGIVKQTGGFIYCDSIEGQGTTFRIFLRRYTLSPADEHSNSPNIKIDVPFKNEKDSTINKNTDLSGSATVLLVEDEHAVRMGGVRALQSRGYQVLEAENGVEALEILEENNGAVDIVVSDVVMPEMDGPTLLSNMKQKYPDIKFVFVSGYAKDAFAKSLPKDAVFGFLSKPFTLKQLALKVKETLEE
nr:response regulator [Bartonella tamiae]